MWLTSMDGKDRRSGRTALLATAHVREAIRTGAAYVWDHCAGVLKPKATEWIEMEIHRIATKLRLDFRLENGKLSQVKSRDLPDTEMLLEDEEELDIMNFREAVQHLAFNLSYSEEEIIKIVHTVLRDEIVGDVHSS